VGYVCYLQPIWSALLANLLLLLGLPYFLVVLSELPVVLIGELMGRLIGWARAIARRSN
jgi:hypothetical protein